MRFGKNNKKQKRKERRNQMHKNNLDLPQSYRGQTNVIPFKKEEPVIDRDSLIEFWGYTNDAQFGKFEPQRLSKLNTWVFYSDCTWLFQNNNIGYFGIKKMDKMGLPNLPKCDLNGNALFNLKYGKIPADILDQIVAFFKAIMARHSGAEAFCQVYWDLQENKYIVHVPLQTVSGAAVRYDKTKDLDKISPERYVFVYECHSHNSMGAFWSGVDNADENELKIFGVYGKLNTATWESKQRFFVGGAEVSLNIDTIFAARKETYTVKISETETIEIEENQVAADSTPRSLIDIGGGNLISVPTEDVKKNTVATPAVPETWFSQVNTPAATQATSYNRSYNYGHGNYSGYGYGSTKYEETDNYYLHSFRGGKSKTEKQLDEAVEFITDYTNGFQDVATTAEVLGCFDKHKCLYPLYNSLADYTGDDPATELTNEAGIDEKQPSEEASDSKYNDSYTSWDQGNVWPGY